jgi:formylglycine-generating enzyme required for sulfatase activity
VGQKRPNDLGLFDMHGNVYNWCQNPQGPYPPAAATPFEDTVDLTERVKVEDKFRITPETEIINNWGRIMRGGAFVRPPARVRCADRMPNRPTNPSGAMCLRVARTLP